MRNTNQRRTITSVILLLLGSIGLLYGCNAPTAASPEGDPTGTSAELPPPVEYRDPAFGFSIALPDSWDGYAVTSEMWNGYTQDELVGDVMIEQGPLIIIHHPLSTPEQPRQEIPIMVFTIQQWESLQEGTWWVSAAPIGPNELARNGSYVFALPPRYNYAFLEGWEEVERIIENQPIQAFEPTGP